MTLSLRQLHLLCFVAMTCITCVACTPATAVRRGGKITLTRDRVADDRYVIELATYHRVIEEGPERFIQKVVLDPVVRRDIFYGFMLVAAGADDDIFASNVLRAGDIIQRVNGLSIERPEDFMRVWNGLRDRRELTLQLIRAGTPISVTWTVR